MIPISYQKRIPMLRAYPFFCLVQPKNFLLTTFALIAVLACVAASDFKDRKQQGSWMVGAKALLLDPEVSSTASTGGKARANSEVPPILNVHYFIARDISLQTVWSYSKH